MSIIVTFNIQRVCSFPISLQYFLKCAKCANTTDKVNKVYVFQISSLYCFLSTITETERGINSKRLLFPFVPVSIGHRTRYNKQ